MLQPFQLLGPVLTLIKGHDALECKENRVLPMNHVADKIPAEAWKALKEASDGRDIPDFKDALQVLVKACPELTYPKLEKEFRDRGFAVYLIALVRPTASWWRANVLTTSNSGEGPWRDSYRCQPTRRDRKEIHCLVLLERQASTAQHERPLACMC
jgi:hypothetical protein